MRRIEQLLIIALTLGFPQFAAGQSAPPDLVLLKADLQRYERPPDPPDPYPNTTTGPTRPGYDLPRGLYMVSRLTVRNTGNRIVYVVNWEYILSDPTSREEVAHFYFQQKASLHPNKTATLTSIYDEARDSAQNQSLSKRYSPKQFNERVAIAFIEYADGTAWQTHVNRPGGVASESSRPRSSSPDGDSSVPPKLNESQTALDTQQPKAASGTTKVPEEVAEGEVLRVDTRLVTIPVIVTDSKGRYVTDLKPEEFHVYEDGVEQPIFSFSQVEQPFFVVLLLDVSGSTSWTLDKLKREAIGFIDQLRPDDYVFVIAFDSTLHALNKEATNDHKVLRDSIMNARPGSSTSLFDAIYSVNNRIVKLSPGRKALILFTDGGENTSMLGNQKNTLHDAEELDALIYAVQYPPFDERKYLRTLVEKTGGQLYEGNDENKIREAFVSLAEELRHQYAVSYHPQSPAVFGQSHNVKVVVTRAEVKVKSRKSYTVHQ